MIDHFVKRALVALLPKGFTLKTRFPDGTIVTGENRSGFGGRGIFIFGLDLEHELRLLPDLIGKGGVFIDVGANVGAFSMRAASIVGDSGRVVSLEPFPRSADRLLANARINGFNHVHLRVCCASDKEGTATFWTKDDRPNSFTLLETPGSWSYNVPTVSIDSLVIRECLAPDLIKIDAEGAENLILEGARGTLEKFRPAIIIEDIIREHHSLPEGYLAFRFGQSHNLVLVHSGSALIKRLVQIGFVEQTERN